MAAYFFLVALPGIAGGLDGLRARRADRVVSFAAAVGAVALALMVDLAGVAASLASSFLAGATFGATVAAARLVFAAGFVAVTGAATVFEAGTVAIFGDVADLAAGVGFSAVLTAGVVATLSVALVRVAVGVTVVRAVVVLAAVFLAGSVADFGASFVTVADLAAAFGEVGFAAGLRRVTVLGAGAGVVGLTEGTGE
ncbi:hypothetical protein [Shimia abyssi]|uniref:hypothetical protein n=1 Tax=Shimia abyssi TaxID=1662395 RepID=UPI000D0D42E9|nr:hypothetical protein [Shimia abyssi]